MPIGKPACRLVQDAVELALITSMEMEIITALDARLYQHRANNTLQVALA
jgi:hypothetical protein